MMARRNNNAAGVLIVGILVVGAVLAILRYTWPLLLAGSAGCLGTYFFQRWNDKRVETELRETRVRQERAQHEARRTSQDLADAQPQTPEDRFATCPKCGYTTMQLIVNDTSAGTTRQCLSCSHEWTIKHQKRAS